jgi:hypothetical protein
MYGIIMLEILHHLERPIDLLTEADRALGASVKPMFALEHGVPMAPPGHFARRIMIERERV